MLLLSWGPMAPPLHRHNTAEARHRSCTFPQLKTHRHRSVQLLQLIQHPIAEMLDRLANKTASQHLQGGNCFAVVETGSQIILGGRRTEVLPQGDVEAEPLAIPALMLQHTNMGPEHQITNMDCIHAGQRGRSTWVKRRVPAE